MRYVKSSPRVCVKYIDIDTSETLLEVNNRTWMNVGELYSDHFVTEVMKQNKMLDRRKLMVLTVAEYDLVE